MKPYASSPLPAPRFLFQRLKQKYIAMPADDSPQVLIGRYLAYNGYEKVNSTNWF